MGSLISISFATLIAIVIIIAVKKYTYSEKILRIKLIHNDTLGLCQDKNMKIQILQGLQNCQTEALSEKMFKPLEWTSGNGLLGDCKNLNFDVEKKTTFKVKSPSCNKTFAIEIMVELDYGLTFKSEIISNWQHVKENILTFF